MHRPARRATAAKRRASQPHIAANRSACAWQGSPLCGFGLRSTQCAACLNTATCAMAGRTTAPAFVLRDPILLPAIITADRAASFGPLNNVLGSACIARCVGQKCETQDCLLWGSHLGQHSKKNTAWKQDLLRPVFSRRAPRPRQSSCHRRTSASSCSTSGCIFLALRTYAPAAEGGARSVTTARPLLACATSGFFASRVPDGPGPLRESMLLLACAASGGTGSAERSSC